LRCRRRAANRANGTAGQAADQGAPSASRQAANGSAGTRTQKSATGRTLSRVIGIRAGGDGQRHPDRQYHWRQRRWRNKPFHREISSLLQRQALDMGPNRGRAEAFPVTKQ
jgi:hypothetical protein